MVLVPVTFVLAALLSAQGAVAAPAAAAPLAARAPAPAPSSSSSGGKKPMTLPLPEKAKTRTHSAKFKAASSSSSSSSKHPSSSSSGNKKKQPEHGSGSGRYHEEFEHHRDERKASHRSKGKGKGKGKSHRKTHKRRIESWGDDGEDAALLEAKVTLGRREDGSAGRQDGHEASRADREGTIKVYERNSEHDSSRRSLVDVDVGSAGPEYYTPGPAAAYAHEASSSYLLDADLDLKKRDGTTYYYYEPGNVVDLEVDLKRRRHDHVHDHYDGYDRDRDGYDGDGDEYGRNRDDYDYDYDRHGHEHVHRRANAPLKFAPLFKATGDGPFKYVGAKQNAVPVQKGGKSKRDDDPAPPNDSCPDLDSGVKGYLQLVTAGTSSKPAPLAELALASEPAPASPFMMDGSTNASRATVHLVKQGDQSDQSVLAVKFVVKLFDPKTASMSCLCTTYNPDDVSPLTLLPCNNNTSTSVSQSFAYDTATSFIAPLAGDDSSSAPSKRNVPAPGMFYAQDGAAENVALPPPAQSTKSSTTTSSTTARATATMEDEESTSSSESTASMTSTSTSAEATMTDEPGTAEDEEPAITTVTETVTSITTATSSIPGVETGAEDEPVEPTKTITMDPTASTSTSAASTPSATDAMSAKDIYLSFSPIVDNIKPADASSSEMTTATESTTATDSTTGTSATATATDSEIPAATATAKHVIDGIPAAVTAKPTSGAQEEDDDLPDCDDEDEDDEDDDSAEVMPQAVAGAKNSATAKATQTLTKATSTISSAVASATDADAPAVARPSKAAAASAAKEDWTAPYRMRFVRDQGDLGGESEPEPWRAEYDGLEEPTIQ